MTPISENIIIAILLFLQKPNGVATKAPPRITMLQLQPTFYLQISLKVQIKKEQQTTLKNQTQNHIKRPSRGRGRFELHVRLSSDNNFREK